MEADDERALLLQKILDLLLAGGYFRARISSLSAFDKLTGGLAWCITASNVDVDFDLFYDDDATLGFKIKVGEAIEGALQKMECPHPLQAHQIQGLDYKAVYPVVQWLVKRVLATREALGEQLRRYSHLRFQENYELPEESALRQIRLERLRAIQETSLKQQAQRLYRRSKNSPIPDDRLDRLRCTLLEYGHLFTRPIVPADSDESPVSSSSLLETSKYAAEETSASSDLHLLNLEDSLSALPASTDGSLTGSRVGRILELRSEEIRDAAAQYLHASEAALAHQNKVASLLKQIDSQEGINNRFQEQIKDAKLTIERNQQNKKVQEAERVRMQAELGTLQWRVDEAGAGDIVQKILPLLEQLKALEKEESDFRANCKRKRAEMQAYIQQLETESLVLTKSDDYFTEVDNAYNTDLLKLKALQQDLAKINQKVASLQRRLDDIPTQTELMQYERCFVELYLNIQAKLRETRKYFATYNSLAEANELTVKEISLLNSINVQFEAAMMTPEGRSKFIDSMSSIAKGVQQKMEKMEATFKVEQNNLAVLKEKHGTAIATRRHYATLVKHFQEECAKNAKLRAALEQPVSS